MQSLESFAKVGAVTAAGAFFGALTLTQFPVTFDEWKHILAPALGAAIAAEFSYLRTQAPAIRDAVLAEVRGLSPQLATLLVQAFQAAKPATGNASTGPFASSDPDEDKPLPVDRRGRKLL